MRFRSRELSELDDHELDQAEVYTLDAILAAAEHYRLMTSAYEAISREQARRLETLG